MSELKSRREAVEKTVHFSGLGVPSIILPLINEQINPIRAPEWIYSVIINYSLQVTFDVEEQGRFRSYHCQSCLIHGALQLLDFIQDATHLAQCFLLRGSACVKHILISRCICD